MKERFAPRFFERVAPETSCLEEQVESAKIWTGLRRSLERDSFFGLEFRCRYEHDCGAVGKPLSINTYIHIILQLIDGRLADQQL